MPALTKSRPSKARYQKLDLTPDYSVEPPDIEDVTDEYSPEYIDMLEKELELAKQQIARGELRPMTNAEIAAAAGFEYGCYKKV